jgi:hypothetical protein
LSYAQLAASGIVALCYANGLLFTGGWLLLSTGSFDIIDGNSRYHLFRRQFCINTNRRKSWNRCKLEMVF